LIAISTYTELVPVNTVENEPPKPQETEEYDRESFAEILSGLMHRSEANLNPEIEIAALPETKVDIDPLSGEELEITEELIFPESLSETKQEDLLNRQIPSGLLSALFNNEYLLNQSAEIISGVNEDEFLPDISALSGLINKNDHGGLELAENFFTAETEQANGMRQIAASNAAAGAENNADNRNELSVKERKSSVSENIENLIAKDDGKEKTADLQNKTENGNYGKQDEVRGRSRRGMTIEVRDMRTETSDGSAQTRPFSAVEAAAGRVQDGAASREIVLELKLPYQNESSAGQNTAQTAWEVKAGNALENMLARELHQNFNGDIVRHASMALRDGGEGTIRIALKPESLGNVKIHLEMTENKITGRIVVESAEALNAFRKEISALEQAFRDSGFANADLNLSLTADGQSADGREQEADSFTPRMAALRYEGEQDILRKVDVFIEQKSGSINMLA